MAMSKGSVSVDDSGSPTGSGLARELYDAHVAAMSADPDFGSDFDDTKLENDARTLKGLAVLANAYADAIVTHLTTNAKARITTGDSGLQRDPATSNNTLAPSVAKDVGIV